MEEYRSTDATMRDIPDKQMTNDEKRAYAVVMGMVAEYENNAQHLEDLLEHALREETRAPIVRLKAADMSPLERPGLHRQMSMEINRIDRIELGPPAFTTATSAASGSFTGNAQPHTTALTIQTVNRATNHPPSPACMSPVSKTHPRDAHTKPRPTPNANNPWYTHNLDIPSTEHHLFTILNDVRTSCSKWTSEWTPGHFRDFARKARTHWASTNHELRLMANGLSEMHEFLVCGPTDWMLSHALSSKTFEALCNVVQDIMPYMMKLIQVDGCAWIDECVRSPLMAIERDLVVLFEERRVYKDKNWNAMTATERLPYKMGEMTMSGC